MTQKQQLALKAIGFAAVSTFLGLSSCSKSPNPTITQEMRDTYQVVSQLYGYVWDDAMFDAPSSERKISKMLERLSENFHRIEENAPSGLLEPGFNTTVLVQEAYLRDIRSRFDAGSKDYAKWRLRSLSQNCIACHSRYSAPIDFIGVAPPVGSHSIEAELAAAQFLFATRQFDDASDRLLSLAGKYSQVESGSADAFRALQLWLAIEVRVKNRYAHGADVLEPLLAKSKFSEDDARSIRIWIADLRRLERIAATAPVDVGTAELLLAPLQEGDSISADNAHLPSTLRASAILHQLLIGKPTMAGLEKPTYLLALAYTHMQIQAFEGFDELYLEQCIRSFPGTPEAAQAYALYAGVVELRSSGSGGIHLDDAQVQKLEQLKGLAAPAAKS